MADETVGGQVVDSGTYYTPESIKQKRKLAEAMMLAGLSQEPIRSGWQGAARLAQAMLGGYDMYKLDQEEKAGQKQLTSVVAGKWGKDETPPTSLSTAGGVTGPTPATVKPDQQKMLGEIRDYWIKNGYTPTQAAALAGQAVHESGGNPYNISAWDNLKNYPGAPHSMGIGQWNGDRAIALVNFARQKGIDIPQGNPQDPKYAKDVISRIPLETQLDFQKQELATTEGRAGAMIKASPDDMVAINKGVIASYRPRGFTWDAPQNGMHFDRRMALAQAAARLPMPEAQVADASGRTVPQAIPGVVLEGLSPETVPGAPTAPAAAGLPSPGPIPQTPPAVTQGGIPAPQMAQPAQASPLTMALPADPTRQVAPAARAVQPPSDAQIEREMWQSLGAQGALLRQAIRSNKPAVVKAAKEQLDQAEARIRSAYAPADITKQAELAYKQSQTRENDAQLATHAAKARQANAEANTAEVANTKIRTRDQIGRDVSAGFSVALQHLDEYGAKNVDRAIGEYAGAAQASPGGFSGMNPASLLRTAVAPVAQLGGKADYWITGGTSPETVRKTLSGDMLAVAANVKDMVRGKGEGVWTDADQELLNKITGDVVTADNIDEARRAVHNARKRIMANWHIDIPELTTPTPNADRPPRPSGNPFELLRNAEVERDAINKRLEQRQNPKAASAAPASELPALEDNMSKPGLVVQGLSAAQQALFSKMVAAGSDPSAALETVRRLLGNPGEAPTYSAGQSNYRLPTSGAQ